VLADKLREEFVRNALAIRGKDRNLFTQDQNVAYCDERTWPFHVQSNISVLTHQRKNEKNVPVVVLSDDIITARYTRRRGKLN